MVANIAVVGLLAVWGIASMTAQQLRVVAPSKAERLSPGGDFLIRWEGIAPTDTVEIFFSPDAGATWRLITPAATGLSFRWRDIPFTLGDSCMILVNTKSRDRTLLVQNNAIMGTRTFRLQFGNKRVSPRWLHRWSGFSFDGMHCITVSSVQNDDSVQQIYRTQVWNITSGQMVLNLPHTVIDSSMRFAPSSIAPHVVQNMLSPDNKLIVNVIDELSFGVYEVFSGRLVRRVFIPIDGFKTSLQYVGWSSDGKAMIARVLYRTQGTGSPGTILTDRFISFALDDTLNVPRVLFSSSVVFDRWGSTYLGLMPHNHRQWLSFRRAGSSERVQEILLHVAEHPDSVRRYEVPSGYRWMPETVLAAPNGEYIALRAMPLDTQSLPILAVIATRTGAVRTVAYAYPISWSPDGQRLLIQRNSVSYPEILNPRTFQLIAGLQDLYATPSTLVLSTTSIISFVPTGQPNIVWRDGGKHILGYVLSPESLTSQQQNVRPKLASTIGVWNTEYGCKTDAFSLPRFAGMSVPIQYSVEQAANLMLDNTQFQMFISNTLHDTAIVLLLPFAPSDTACQRAYSELWSIRFPNLVFAPETVEPTPVVCEPSVLVRIPVTNVSGSALQVTTTLQTISAALSRDGEFRLEKRLFETLSGRATDTIIVRFTPAAFGNRSVQVLVQNPQGTVLARTTINARKDSLAFEPAIPVVNLGNIPANTVITTTFTVRNTGNTRIIWSTSATRTTDGSIFITNITPQIIAPRESSEVLLRVQPVDSLGLLRRSFPLFICGADTTRLSVHARVLPEFQQIEAPVLIDGGFLSCVDTVFRSIVLRNIGGRNLILRALDLSDTNFRILNLPSLPLVLAPLDSLVLRVRMATPTNGIRTSILRIFSDDPARSVVEVALRLRQEAPIYTWIPESFRFEAVDIRTATEATIEFRNTGQPYSWFNLPRTIAPGFTIVSATPNPTPSGGVSRIVLRFEGTNQSGIISTIASFNLGDICSTQTRLALEVVSVQPGPKLGVRPFGSFGSLLCETEREYRVELFNTGRSELRIDSAYIEESPGVGRSVIADFVVREDSARLFPIRIPGVSSTVQRSFLTAVFRPQRSGVRTAWLVLH
ncbi:MAG: hypothetical protein RML40_07715, partial [Bacteroidota bacterium]|nr:DUF1573 domain-containing protein [Candidatus Kapabacteria bacterium]MDW8220402.1 hypothetical protein [Bacteroidota bacterium]